MDLYTLVIFILIISNILGMALSFKRGMDKGYTKGAEEVLEEWKKYMRDTEDDI